MAQVTASTALAGANTLIGGFGFTNSIIATNGSNFVFGNEGNDTASLQTGSSTVIGGHNDDIITTAELANEAVLIYGIRRHRHHHNRQRQ